VLALMSAGGIALLAAAFLMPLLIRFQVQSEIGQHIRDDGPATHAVKAGTPTMGGLIIVIAVALGYFAGHLWTAVQFSPAGVLCLITVVGFGLVGFIDDAMKIRNRRSLGLNKRAKIAGQLVVGAGFAILAVEWEDLDAPLGNQVHAARLASRTSTVVRHRRLRRDWFLERREPDR